MHQHMNIPSEPDLACLNARQIVICAAAQLTRSIPPRFRSAERTLPERLAELLWNGNMWLSPFCCLLLLAVLAEAVLRSTDCLEESIAVAYSLAPTAFELFI